MMAIEVYLDNVLIGRGELCKSSSILGPRTLKDEVEATIATICFLRGDDLLSSHSYEDFTVKGIRIWN